MFKFNKDINDRNISALSELNHILQKCRRLTNLLIFSLLKI